MIGRKTTGRDKATPLATLLNTNPIWTTLALWLGLCSDKPVTSVRHGEGYLTSEPSLQVVFVVSVLLHTAVWTLLLFYILLSIDNTNY